MRSLALNKGLNANFHYIWKYGIGCKIYRVFSFGLAIYFRTTEIRYHYMLCYWLPFQLIPSGYNLSSAWQDKRGQISSYL